MHDRVAELAGLRAELAICKNGPRESRRDTAGQVQEQIDRVRGELDAVAGEREKRAEQLLSDGQAGAAGVGLGGAPAYRLGLGAVRAPDRAQAAGGEGAPAGG